MEHISESVLSKLVAIEQLVAAQQRDFTRLEQAIQRADDNVDSTRHAIVGQIQKEASYSDAILDKLKELQNELRPISGAASDAQKLGQQASGGMQVAKWAWPVIVALAALAGLGGGVWIR